MPRVINHRKLLQYNPRYRAEVVRQSTKNDDVKSYGDDDEVHVEDFYKSRVPASQSLFVFWGIFISNVFPLFLEG